MPSQKGAPRREKPLLLVGGRKFREGYFFEKGPCEGTRLSLKDGIWGNRGVEPCGEKLSSGRGEEEKNFTYLVSGSKGPLRGNRV